MKVAIVGNAIPERSFCDEIASCDKIIRFSQARSMGEYTGTKTNILVYVGGVPGVTEFDDVWIHTWLHQYREQEILDILSDTQWSLRPFRLLYQDTLALDLRLLRNKVASSGFLILQCLLHFPVALMGTGNLELNLFCFTWEGSEAHDWEEEQRICRALQAAGKITIHENLP